MQVKFVLSGQTYVILERDGKHCSVYNVDGNILLTLTELDELNKVMGKIEQSKQDFVNV